MSVLIVFIKICKYCGFPLSESELKEKRKVHEKCKKAHHIELKRKWRKANPEERKIEGKRYRGKYGDQLKVRNKKTSKKYRETHKEQIKDKQREYRIKKGIIPRPILSEEEKISRRRANGKRRYYEDIEKSRASHKTGYKKYYKRHPDREKVRRQMQHITEFFGGKKMLQYIPSELIELRKLHLTLVHEVNNNLKEANYG